METNGQFVVLMHIVTLGAVRSPPGASARTQINHGQWWRRIGLLSYGVTETRLNPMSFTFLATEDA